eukprot:m.288337 g.288337  ORF g.288337 m.288337 type:complete len:337 (-) comp11952_c0_seq1:1018-2028(-)
MLVLGRYTVKIVVAGLDKGVLWEVASLSIVEKVVEHLHAVKTLALAHVIEKERGWKVAGVGTPGYVVLVQTLKQRLLRIAKREEVNVVKGRPVGGARVEKEAVDLGRAGNRRKVPINHAKFLCQGVDDRERCLVKHGHDCCGVNLLGNGVLRKAIHGRNIGKHGRWWLLAKDLLAGGLQRVAGVGINIDGVAVNKDAAAAWIRRLDVVVLLSSQAVDVGVVASEKAEHVVEAAVFQHRHNNMLDLIAPAGLACRCCSPSHAQHQHQSNERAAAHCKDRSVFMCAQKCKLNKTPRKARAPAPEGTHKQHQPGAKWKLVTYRAECRLQLRIGRAGSSK